MGLGVGVGVGVGPPAVLSAIEHPASKEAAKANANMPRMFVSFDTEFPLLPHPRPVDSHTQWESDAIDLGACT